MLKLLRDRSFSALTLTQFLGAFNDNAFKQLVLLLSLSTSIPWIAELPWAEKYGQALGGALFAAPFVMFGALTGSLADRFSKRSVMVAANLLEVVVMALGAAAFALQSFELLLAAVFLMGSQSSLFGPAKYGAIPELSERKDLSRANGLIQLTTFVAIVCGTSLGAWLYDGFRERLWIPATIYLCISSLGLVASLFMRDVPASAPTRRLDWNPPRELLRQWSLVRGSRPLVLSILASAFFFLLGQTLLLVINQYGVWLDQSGTQIGLLLAVLSLSIAAGSALAARLSGDRIESGLIPAGLLGVGLSTLSVLFAPHSVAWLRTCLIGAGLSVGLFTVPIRALIQHLPRPEDRGSVLGFSEVADFVGILVASGLFALLKGGFALSPPHMLAVLGGMTLVFSMGSVLYTAEFAVRFWLALVVRTFYRLDVRGAENLPARGGALIVCNHLSFVDAFLVAASVGRPVRFMMYRDFFRLPLVGTFARRMGAIPVSHLDSREQKQESIECAAAMLRSGEVVCIFAEGAISRTGSLMPFRRGLERIARAANVPIVPFALDGLWGSIFSHEGGRFFWKRPSRIPYPVRVLIGAPMPPESSAWQVRACVQQLVSESRADLSGEKDTLTGRYLRAARKHSRRLALVDSLGARLTHGRLLVSVLALSRLFRVRFANEQRVGVLLPPGAGGAVATLAISLAGKVPIPLNYSLGPELLAEPIRRAGLEHVISSPRFLQALGMEGPLPHVETLDLQALAGELKRRDKLTAYLLSKLPGGLLARWLCPVKSPRATATILFSSGSTGSPKGVVLTHANVLSNVIAVSHAVHLTHHDRLLGVLPFFHSFGFTATLWAPLFAGAAGVYHARPTDAAKIGELCEAEGVTMSIATPTFYQAWMRRIRPEQLAHLRLAITGAERLRASLAVAFRERYGTELLEGYGCTELSPAVCVNLSGSNEDAPGHEHVHRQGSVGRPLAGVAVKIVDPASGAELAPGVEGSVLVKGPNVMQGYLDEPQRTAEVLVDGWYDTGDVGVLDRDGFLVLTDRRSRFAKIGGEMVPQGRVEERLDELAAELAQPLGVEPPRLAVSAVPDDRKGERLVVLHTALPFALEELVAALAASDLPALFQPRADQYFEVEELPLLGTGKLDLRALKDRALDLAEAG
jgi:acyl-[acyl-carrier-protein]-phospholipid O-acyltransferase/long-chain-fatty-acid--[acyl-carrier-protein] ligase